MALTCLRSQVDTITFLEKLNIKDGSDKDQFFRRLAATLDQLPPAVVQRKVLPLIASGLEFGSAPSAAFASLLHAARELTPDQMRARVLPCVIRLFGSTDRTTRVALLQHMNTYVELMTNEQMESIYEQLATGFNDGTAYLRELTLKSLLQVAPKLSQRTMTSSLLKHLAKLQVDEEPAIRANTTICLGNLSRFLGAAACKRVLLNAFTRALRDPFPPARAAGLLALQATIMHYDASEGALRVLPCVTPLTLDADAAVRAAAFDVTDAFVGLLRKHHQARAGEVQSADSAAAAGTKPLVPGGDAPAAVQSSGGLLGWAVGGMGALAAVVGAPSTTPEKAKPSPTPASRASYSAVASSPRRTGPTTQRQPEASDGWGRGQDDDDGVDEVRASRCVACSVSKPRRFSCALQEEVAARARLTRAGGGAGAASAVAAQAGGGDWDVDDEPLEDLQPARAAAPPSYTARPAAAPPSRPVVAHVRPTASVGGATKPMKLGASKLGASKLKGGDLDLEALLAD